MSQRILIHDGSSSVDADALVKAVLEFLGPSQTKLLVRTDACVNHEDVRIEIDRYPSPLSFVQGIALLRRLRRFRPDVVIFKKHDVSLKRLFALCLIGPRRIYGFKPTVGNEIALSPLSRRLLWTMPWGRKGFWLSLLMSFIPFLVLCLLLLVIACKAVRDSRAADLQGILWGNLKRGPVGDSPWLFMWLQVCMAMQGLRVRPQQTSSAGPCNILVVRIDHIGDAVNTVPLLRHLRQTHPQATIKLLCNSTSFFWTHCPYLDEVMVYQTNNPLIHRSRKRWRYSLQPFRLRKRLRQEHFDLVIDPVGRTESHIISFLCGQARRISRTYYPYRLFETQVYTHYDCTLHETQRVLQLVKPWDQIKSQDHYLEWWPPEMTRSWARETLSGLIRDHRRKILAIHPGAMSPLRHWPIERYARVAAELVQSHDLWVLFFEPPDQMGLGQAFRRAFSPNDRFHIVRDITLEQYTCLVAQCHLLICADSGPMHLALAMGTPTVALFGPGEYYRWQPQDGISRMVRKPVGCSPCSQHQCDDTVCMKGIEIRDVVRQADQVLLMSRTR